MNIFLYNKNIVLFFLVIYGIITLYGLNSQPIKERLMYLKASAVFISLSLLFLIFISPDKDIFNAMLLYSNTWTLLDDIISLLLSLGYGFMVIFLIKTFRHFIEKQ